MKYVVVFEDLDAHEERIDKDLKEYGCVITLYVLGVVHMLCVRWVALSKVLIDKTRNKLWILYFMMRFMVDMLGGIKLMFMVLKMDLLV